MPTGVCVYTLTSKVDAIRSCSRCSRGSLLSALVVRYGLLKRRWLRRPVESLLRRLAYRRLSNRLDSAAFFANAAEGFA